MDAARETLDLAQDAKRHSMQRIVREFLAWCRRDGFYAFEVSGETFLLETEADEETIFEAIYASSPAVIRYREAQAMRYLPNAPHQATASTKLPPVIPLVDVKPLIESINKAFYKEGFDLAYVRQTLTDLKSKHPELA